MGCTGFYVAPVVTLPVVVQQSFPQPHPQPWPATQNLVDLVDLADSGELVAWPRGFDLARAKAFLEDHRYAVDVCMLYTGN